MIRDILGACRPKYRPERHKLVQAMKRDREGGRWPDENVARAIGSRSGFCSSSQRRQWSRTFRVMDEAMMAGLDEWV